MASVAKTRTRHFDVATLFFILPAASSKGVPIVANDHADNDQGGANEPFQTLRDQVRLATPVHPPSDPAADQRRRSRSLRRLLRLFTGQHYPDPDDFPGGAGSASAPDGSQPGGLEMLGGWRDADSPAATDGPASAGIHSFDVGAAIKGASSGEPGTSSAPIHWDQPLALPGGSSFSMPSELPTALPTGQTIEPWLAANTQGSIRSPAYAGIATPTAPLSAIAAGINESFNSPDLPAALIGSSGSIDTADGPGQSPSALQDNSLGMQLAAPAAALPTGLPASQPESPASEFGSQQLESTDAAVASFGLASSDAAGEEGSVVALPGMTASQDSGASGAGSATSGGGMSISVEIPDLPGILAAAAQAGLPGFQSAAREVAAALSSSVDAAFAQIKDVNSRFDEHQMFELMKSSQMRAIYRR
jgi:hypothetical protein